VALGTELDNVKLLGVNVPEVEVVGVTVTPALVPFKEAVKLVDGLPIDPELGPIKATVVAGNGKLSNMIAEMQLSFPPVLVNVNFTVPWILNLSHLPLLYEDTVLEYNSTLLLVSVTA